MSRLIKKSLAIPAGSTVTANGGVLNVKGGKGELKLTIPAGVELKIEGTEMWVSAEKVAAAANGTAIAGTFWSLAKNAMIGTTEGFTKVLELEGVGYLAGIAVMYLTGLLV